MPKPFWRSWVAALVLATLAGGIAFAAQKQIIRPPGTTPGGNYTPGSVIDDTLYISGQADEDKNGKIPASFEAEVKQALEWG